MFRHQINSFYISSHKKIIVFPNITFPFSLSKYCNDSFAVGHFKGYPWKSVISTCPNQINNFSFLTAKNAVNILQTLQLLKIVLITYTFMRGCFILSIYNHLSIMNRFFSSMKWWGYRFVCTLLCKSLKLTTRLDFLKGAHTFAIFLVLK